jgi:Uma2 family endonuclease
MTPGLSSAGAIETLADLLEHLGGIPPDRVWFHPTPGTATEADVLKVHDHNMILGSFVRPRNPGLVTGAGGMMRLAPGLVRIPDVAFVSWSRLPNRRVPTDPIPDVAPDLAVEVLGAGNTAREMARKCREYFVAGVHLVWFVDPQTRTVAVYTTPEQSTVLHAEHTLEGGTVLPGFTLPLRELFTELDRQGNG